LRLSFSHQYDLKQNGDSSYKTFIGFLTTIAIAIITFFSIKESIIDCIYKIKPKFYLTSSALNETDVFINETMFNFTINIVVVSQKFKKLNTSNP
jgi:hypothetical protein